MPDEPIRTHLLNDLESQQEAESEASSSHGFGLGVFAGPAGGDAGGADGNGFDDPASSAEAAGGPSAGRRALPHRMVALLDGLRDAAARSVGMSTTGGTGGASELNPVDTSQVAAELRGDVERLEAIEWAGVMPPSAEAMRAAARAAARTQAAAGGPGAMAPVLVVRPHPAEPLLGAFGRESDAHPGSPGVLGTALAALERGASVLFVSDRYGSPVAATMADALAGACGQDRVAFVEDTSLDALRAAAACPEVALDVVAPDAFESGLAGSLARIREKAAMERVRSEATPDMSSWFGHGIIDEPPAPIHVRPLAGSTLTIAADGEGFLLARDWGTDSSVDERRVDDVQAAAASAADAAYGAEELGGFAAGAVARIVVDPLHFAAFTAAFLARMKRVDRSDTSAPPDWAIDGKECAGALAAARRIALDEGATLVFERTSRAAERPVPLGWVFTNVEPRMRLGGTLRALGGVALLRG